MSAPRKHDRNPVLDRWQAGEAGPDIAAAIGMPYDTVRRIVWEARKEGDPRATIHREERRAAQNAVVAAEPAGSLADARRESGWTPLRVAWLAKLYREGIGFTDIGTKLGVSRGAVGGKLDRLGLMTPTPRSAPRAPARPAARSQRSSALANKIRAGTFGQPAKPAPPPKPRKIDLAEPKSRDVPLMDLAAGDCRYPHWEGPFLFCGHPAEEGSSYCAFHTRLTSAPPTARNDRGLSWVH